MSHVTHKDHRPKPLKRVMLGGEGPLMQEDSGSAKDTQNITQLQWELLEKKQSTLSFLWTCLVSTGNGSTKVPVALYESSSPSRAIPKALLPVCSPINSEDLPPKS